MEQYTFTKKKLLEAIYDDDGEFMEWNSSFDKQEIELLDSMGSEGFSIVAIIKEKKYHKWIYYFQKLKV